MNEFEKELKAFCNRPTGPYLRPFSPNPAWRTASVFIIGTNPATPFRDEFDSFEQYWTGLTQTPDTFWERMQVAGTSKTTANVRKLLKELSDINFLITNVSWFPAKEFKGEAKAARTASSKMRKRLIDFCAPKVLFFHGRWARRFALEAYGVSLDCYAPPHEQTKRVEGKLLLAYHHFSGMGLPKGSRFKPCIDIPAFANRILAEVGGHL